MIAPVSPSSYPPAQPDVTSSAAIERMLDYDVAIVGGGLVGLTFACALQRSGLRIVVIESSQTSAAATRGQAYHVSLMSSQIFQSIDVWEVMLPQVNPIAQIHLSDADYPCSVQFTCKDLGGTDSPKPEALGYVAEHRVLLEALQQHLQDKTTVTHLCPATVVAVDYQPDYAELELEQAGQSQWLRTRLVVAADGARSPLRQQANLATYGWNYWQSCVVAFIEPEYSHQDIAYERFQPEGPFAILPLPNNLCRIVWTAPKAEAERLLTMNEAEFLACLQQRYGNHMGRLTLVGDRSVFPVRLMHSPRYTLPRLALIGDAAHCCHPVGGQGINLGFRDAAALAQVLTIANQRGEDIGQLQVLQRYDRWRKLENLVILGFTDLLNRAFSNQFKPIVLLRRLGLHIMQLVPPVKRLALYLMIGLLGRKVV
jgi:2-octaprenyl-6-methoxyphenol hydroxylase